MRYIYRAVCYDTVDGDTIRLDLDLGCSVHRRETCRLYRINTPETFGRKKGSDEWKLGMAAKERLQELVEGKALIVETLKDKTGKFGRLLAWLWVDDGSPDEVIRQENKSVNEILVDEGHSEWVDY